jgi:hypothetical protein
MLVHEVDRVLDCLTKVRSDVDAIDKAASIRPLEPSRLDPGVRKMAFSVLAEPEHAANRRDASSLMPWQHVQRFEIGATQGPNRS